MAVAKRVETISTASVAVIASSVALLDLAGALDGIGWLKARIPVLTLLVAGILLGYLVVGRQGARRDVEEVVADATQGVVDALDGVRVQQFDSRAAFLRYVTQRIREARFSVDDLTWGRYPASSMTSQDLAAYAEYRRQVARVASGKGRYNSTLVRELMSFPDGRRIPSAAALMDVHRYPNYQLRYYDFDHSGTPLLLQFFIIDGAEVLISSPSSVGGETAYVTFTNAKLARALSSYFAGAWRDAVVLKDVRLAHTDLLEEIKRRFP